MNDEIEQLIKNLQLIETKDTEHAAVVIQEQRDTIDELVTALKFVKHSIGGKSQYEWVNKKVDSALVKAKAKAKGK